jgi:hypothetical protein
MNSPLLYQWRSEIDKQFAGELGWWQRWTLALLSLGISLAHSCTLNQVARQWMEAEHAASLERRFQRFLANSRINLTRVFPIWIGWVAGLWGQAMMLILIDETKLSQHVSVMVVSVYYQHSAIPLVWRAYCPEQYPAEGQVGVLSTLMQQLRDALPPHCQVVVMADRGLSTSPEWLATLDAQGWEYLLRVQGSTRLRLAKGTIRPLKHLVGYGQRWTGRAQVFKKAQWRSMYVYLLWEQGYREPWCLVSTRADLDPLLYGWRFSQESSFRDLKSDGFDWQRSRVWMPSHVERLLLALALACLQVLALGTVVSHLYPLSARRRRLSLFRLGLETLLDRLRSSKPGYLELFLAPDTPSVKSVVP